MERAGAPQSYPYCYTYPPQPAAGFNGYPSPPSAFTDDSSQVLTIVNQQHPEDVSPFVIQSFQQAAKGVPVYQPAVAFQGATAVPVMPATPHKVQQSDEAAEECSCSAGWSLFGVGWLLPVCWIVAVFLPLCSKSRNDKRAAVASAIMLVVYIIVIVVLLATAPAGQWYAYSAKYSSD